MALFLYGEKAENQTVLLSGCCVRLAFPLDGMVYWEPCKKERLLEVQNVNFYDKKENVEQYRSMMQFYDNSTIIRMVKEVLPVNSTILELGMGTGKDLLEFAKDYKVVGSDASEIFISDFRNAYPDFDIYKINAADFCIDRKFDCIYSNKVLCHLSAAELKQSLKLQAQHLNDKGIVFMTMWYGTYKEKVYGEGLRFTYYTEADIIKTIPANLSVEKMLRYTEEEPDDSLLLVLRIV